MKDYNLSAVARGDQTDFVSTGHTCDVMTTTDECSDDVLINGIGVVRRWDACTDHKYPVGDYCPIHTTLMGSGSPTVFANDDGSKLLTISTMGDDYIWLAPNVLTSSHPITVYRDPVESGGKDSSLNCSPNVFAIPGDHL